MLTVSYNMNNEVIVIVVYANNGIANYLYYVL